MERNLKYQTQPQHRRKTPSFSSSLLDSILRSIDESNDENSHHRHQQQPYGRDHDHDHDIRFFASEPKRSSKMYSPQTHTINGDDHQQMPSLRRAIMIDQWMETHTTNTNTNNNTTTTNNNNHDHNGYVSSKSCRKFSSDSSSSGTTTTSSGTETPSTYRSLPNSFTISRKTAEVDFRDDTRQQVNSINKREMKFMKSTRLKAMKIYGDLKNAKQPMSPGSRISTFLYSLFASSSSKKAKIEETMRSLKKSRSIKQDATATCTASFSRSCMSKKQRNSSVKRSVRFYPENDTVNILDRKSIHEHDPNLMQLPKHERRWLQEKNYKSFVVDHVEDEDEDEDEDDEDDLFELEIVGGLGNHVGYGQELPVFETTDLRKIRI